MKEKQNKRWGLKLLSVLCAFLVWLGVVNVADPVMTSTVEVRWRSSTEKYWKPAA